MARRIIGSYMVLLLSFATTMALGYNDLQRTAQDAELLRSTLVPLQLQVGQLLAEQNVLTTQLNHATSAENPGDVRDWIESSRRSRPRTMQTAIRYNREISSRDQLTRGLRTAIDAEFLAIEKLQEGDVLAYARLFAQLTAGDRDAAGKTQGELVKREAEVAMRLRTIKLALDDSFVRQSERARARESQALKLLLAVSALTLLVGAALSIYARRVLKPLSRVTSRARHVAAGDLTPQVVVPDQSEIGELALTFETMVGAIRDARRELVKTERLATVGKMAARITHEIRNPLSAIGLNLELLEGELLEGETATTQEQRDLFAAIQAETARLSRVAEQYLSLARKPQPQLELDSVVDLLEEIVAFLRPELSRALVDVRLTVRGECPELMLDEGLFRQAILNLVRNAREAMSEGGVLELVVEPADAGVFVLVCDDGPGVPAHARESIFDPFISTKDKGTGLGLAVTREIVDSHGGAITCEARSPNGTCFRILLPLPA